MASVLGGAEDYTGEGNTFHLLSSLSSGLSVLGSLAVIVVFLAFPQLRRFFARLVVYLALSDLWLCTSLLLGQVRAPHHSKCYLQSAFGTFFGLSSILWTGAIAHCLRRLLHGDLAVEGLEGRLHLICWGLPSAASLLCAVTGVWGPAGTQCWIRNTSLGAVMRFLTFFLPLWLCVGYSLWVYRLVMRNLQALLEQQEVHGDMDAEVSAPEMQARMERHRLSLRALLLMPLVLALCWTPSTVRRVAEAFGWSGLSLDYLIAASGPLQGALNALLYGATPAVRDLLWNQLDHSREALQRRLKRSGRLIEHARKFKRFRGGHDRAAQIGRAVDP